MIRRLFIDGRMLFHTGIGRYFRNILKFWEQDDRIDSGWVLLPRGMDYPLEKFMPIPSSMPLYSWQEQLCIPWLIKKYQPEIYYSPHYVYPFLAPSSLPVILEIHDLIHLRSSWYKQFAANHLIKNALSKSRAIITHSQYTKREIEQTFTHCPEIYSVAEGIEPEFFDTPPLEALLYLKHKYRLPDKFILTSGGKFKHKNIEHLRHVVEDLNRRMDGDPFSLVVIGNYGVTSGYRIKNTIYLPYLNDDEIQMLYRLAHIFVFPTRDEGFGLPILEALASCTPVLCSKIPVFEEYFSNRVLFFDPDEELELLAQIGLLNQDEELYQDFVKNGQDFARTFSWENAANQNLDILEKVYESRNRN